MAMAILFLEEQAGAQKAPIKCGVRDVPLDHPFEIAPQQRALVYKVFKDPKGGLPTVYARKVD